MKTIFQMTVHPLTKHNYDSIGYCYLQNIFGTQAGPLNMIQRMHIFSKVIFVFMQFLMKYTNNCLSDFNLEPQSILSGLFLIEKYSWSWTIFSLHSQEQLICMECQI